MDDDKLLIIEVEDIEDTEADEAAHLHQIRDMDVVLLTDGDRGRFIKDNHGPAREVSIWWGREIA